VLRHLPIRIAAEAFEAGNIPCRDDRLVKESMQFVQSLKAVALFARQWLALLTNVNAVAAPAKLLVRT
jgi:hypothetical protein